MTSAGSAVLADHAFLRGMPADQVLQMLAAAVRRLQATRIRLLDLYAPPGGG